MIIIEKNEITRMHMARETFFTLIIILLVSLLYVIIIPTEGKMRTINLTIDEGDYPVNPDINPISILESNTPIYPENLTDNGIAWRISDNYEKLQFLNLRGINKILFVSTGNKDHEGHLLVLNRSQITISGTLKTVNKIIHFYVNYTNPYIKNKKANPTIVYIDEFNLTDVAEDFPRITAMSAIWNSNISKIHLVLAYETRADGNEQYTIYQTYWSEATGWSSLSSIDSNYGYIKGISMSYDSTTNFTLIEYGAIATTNPNFYSAIMKVYDGSSLISITFNKKTDISISNIYLNGTIGFSFINLKAGPVSSEIYLCTYSSGILQTSAGGIWTSEDLEDYGIYSDFKDLYLVNLKPNASEEYLVLVWISYSDYQNYLTMAIYDLIGGKAYTDPTIIESKVNPEMPVLLDNFYDDTEIDLLWIDRGTLVEEIYRRQLIWNGSTIIWNEPKICGQTNYTTISFTGLKSKNYDLLIFQISYFGYNKTIYSMIGYKDQDLDGLGDFEEDVYYQSSFPGINSTLVDSDNDGINDGAEKLLYGTNPVSSDTDGDGLSDKFELSIDPAQKNNYLTDPLVIDTDGDSLNDSDEVLGLSAGYSTNPLQIDTDNDGLNDSEEILFGIEVHVETSIITIFPNATLKDSDFDNLTDIEEKTYLTNPINEDTDGDGLSDWYEIVVYKTDPHLLDTDNDGLSDHLEFIYGTDPSKGDSDSDGLSDLNEIGNETNPTIPDTDGDGLTDFAEVTITLTNATEKDTDGDNLTDYEEVQVFQTDPLVNDTDDDGVNDYSEVFVYGTNPLLNDTDGDGLCDCEELFGIYGYNTNPLTSDTDGDEISDKIEIDMGSNPLKQDSDDDGLTDPMELELGTDLDNNDTDGDGLTDYEEYVGLNITNLGLRRTNPLSNDTDNDGLLDEEEFKLYYTDPTLEDTDGDGLKDSTEININTNPLKEDTDGDRLSDYEEYYVYGTNPLSVDSDGDGLVDFYEVKVLHTDPTSGDSDGDFIPDNIDFLLPTFSDWVIIAIITVSSLLAYGAHYGIFRNWREDALAIGIADVGGTPMIVVPEEFSRKHEVDLISPALSGIYQLTSEIAGGRDVIVLSGAVSTIVSKGKNTFLWLMSKKSYPRIVKITRKIHMRIEKKYGDVLAGWGGLEDELKDIKKWIQDRLKEVPKKRKKKRKKIKPKKEKSKDLLEELKEIEPKDEDIGEEFYL